MNNGRLHFFNLVKAMREAQKDYFKTRSPHALTKSRQMEKQVDDYIQRGDAYLAQQQPEQKTLFD